MRPQKLFKCPLIHTYRMSKRRPYCHISDIVYCFVIDITYVMARYQIYDVVCRRQTYICPNFML